MSRMKSIFRLTSDELNKDMDMKLSNRQPGPPESQNGLQGGRFLRAPARRETDSAHRRRVFACRHAELRGATTCYKASAAHRGRESACRHAELRGATTCYKASAAHRRWEFACRHAELRRTTASNCAEPLPATARSRCLLHRYTKAPNLRHKGAKKGRKKPGKIIRIW